MDARTVDPSVVVYLISAAIFLVGFIVTFAASRKKKRCSATATASVVTVERDEETTEYGEKDYSYRPVLVFDANGTTVRRAANISSARKRAFREGDELTVKYNPKKPQEFLVKGRGAGGGAGIFLMILSVLIAAAVFYFTHR